MSPKDISAPTTPFPFYEVEGDAVSIGDAYGRLAQDRIERSIEIYQDVCASYDLTWDTALSHAQKFLDQLAEFDGDQHIELNAVAKGAGVKAAEVMVINARTDIMYGIKGAENIKEDGCTGAIALPEATATGSLIHGQNWDWRDACKDTVVVVAARPSKGPARLNLMEAGTLSRCGLNEHGVALTANFLRCDHDPGKSGIPSPFIRRRVLSSESLAKAAETMVQSPRSFSNNIMLSDAKGIALNLETTPREYYWLRPTDGLLVHANHFASPTGRARVFDTGIAVTPDSIYREERVQQFLCARSGKITVDTMIEAFADDFGSPASVNRPPHFGPGGDGVSTVATIVMDVTKREMTVVPTPYAKKTTKATYQLAS